MDTQAIKSILERLVRERDAVKEGQALVDAVLSLEQAEKDLSKKVANFEKRNEELAFEASKFIDIVNEGKAKAEEIIKDGRKKADELVAEAKAKADAFIKAAFADAELAASELANLNSKKAAAEIDTALAINDLNKLKSEIAELEKIKADMLAKFQ